ncbi:GntR family transcriptional regulator [Actinosynnema mirum]|uniref:Transcriptional regulator, GntR family n=1 Tax=Actinosynnema mirum (strain ATCC 29888 / DSM 43827 / JCM 3225 / NBRC 14064 / NCIMB 13271 / NRRL B-12336 / IMRU 3971 / 101) TaxID=446462 RepID=C6WC33_ACTMD|nr:GntR family transcriptional regulator [Actinosynnema mirum]ACU39421.1 transcriptional regulator, GntR family [Actinosynnema mirum DSM 43827]
MAADTSGNSAQRIAQDLLAAIERGEYAPGHQLPSQNVIKARYGVAAQTVQNAFALLHQQGVTEGRHGAGTFVREHRPTVVIPIDHSVYRDDRGYYFGRATQSYDLIGKPSVTVGRAPQQVAQRLSVPSGSSVVVRHRVLGTAGEGGQPGQIATSYLPGWLAEELPVVGEASTGSGGIYDRIEEWAGGPLSWPTPRYGAVPASAEDGTSLRVAPGTPLLTRYRVAVLPDGRPVELNVTRWPGSRYEFEAGDVVRDESAAWPTAPLRP